MKRAVIALLVAVALAAGLLGADIASRNAFESRVAASLEDALGLDEPPTVTTGGWPFLTQLARGTIDTAHLAAPGAQLGDLWVEQVAVELDGVSTSEPYRAGRAHVSAYVPLESIREVNNQALEFDIEGGQLRVGTSILGLEVRAGLELRPVERAVVADVASISAAGVTVQLGSLPGGVADLVGGVRVPLDQLPQGMELTEVSVATGGVDLVAEGRDVEFDVT